MGQWTPPDGERVLFDGRSRAGSAIVVTTHHCRANGDWFAIAELEALGVSRGELPIRRGRGSAGLLVVCVLLALVIVAIGVGWTRQWTVAAAVAVIATAALSALPMVMGPALRRPYQVWVRHHGVTVRVFVTDDREQYGQVARALTRARELTGGGSG